MYAFFKVSVDECSLKLTVNYMYWFRISEVQFCLFPQQIN